MAPAKIPASLEFWTRKISADSGSDRPQKLRCVVGKNMSPRLFHPSLEEARRVFKSAYWNNLSDGASRQTPNFADRMIERQTQENFEILDALSNRDQLIFRGGPGTGKTWIALELAKCWAALGRQVLFLCHNLALERWLKIICSRLSDRIVVQSYRSLAEWLLGRVR